MKLKRNSSYGVGALCAAMLLAGSASAAAGDASLDRLEIKLDGKNIISSFNKNQLNYEITLDEDAATTATFSASPSSASSVLDININGVNCHNHSVGSLVGGENRIKYIVKNGSDSKVYTIKITTPVVARKEYFTWKNANMYFVFTDRFYNGDTSNDNSYHRKRLSGAADVATFHGGDIKGLTQKLDYLDKLGINSIWITAPYEQMHGWTGGKNDAFPHYAFHGYYALDWTYMDRNMGTIADMKNFVTEAHKRGIRVVMDIVLNHTGYCTLDDGVDYDFGNFNGTPTAGWVPEGTPYSMWAPKNDVSFNADTQGKWGNWWSGWVRAFSDHDWYKSAGFAAAGNDDKTMSLAGLPDVVTEQTSAVQIPPFLQKKWDAEKGGDYDAYRLPNLESWREGGKGAPADYIINWLAGWVEYFGIDGFRCDTAKHVELSRWNQLKETCRKALNNWRQSDRADEYAKDWTDDFWMTGECFGWQHGDTGYFTEGNFDSMINFAFNSTEGGSGRTPTTDDWKYYANFCNGSNGRQVLNYVSSHDTGLHRPGDQKKVATMFLLCPGGAQIYYGDETSRGYISGCPDQSMSTRSDFNWDAVDNDDNKHWQIIGQFRRRNPAVGAGTQTDLGSDTYARKFSADGYTNAVVIKLNTQAGQTYSVSVGDAFSDGQRVMDGYNNNTVAAVSGGKVSMKASGPVLLIEEFGSISGGGGGYEDPGETKPEISASPNGGDFVDEVTVALSVNPIGTPIHYSTNGTATASSPVYTEGLTFTESTTLSVFASNSAGSTTQEFKFNKVEAPAPGQAKVSSKPADGATFQDEITVELSVNPAGVPIHYAVNGTATASSPVYTKPLKFTETTTLSVFTDNEGVTNTQSFTYTKTDLPPQPEVEVYVLLKNTANWSNPTVWAWVDDNTSSVAAAKWPGDAMTKDGDYWRWELPEGKTTPKYIIFSNNGGSKTKNLDFVNKQIYDCKGNKVNGDDPTPPVGDKITVYFDNSVSNWSNVKIHYFGGDNPTDWPGVDMQKVEGNIWSYQVPANTTGLVFNNGSGQQTNNFTCSANHLYDRNSDQGVYNK